LTVELHRYLTLLRSRWTVVLITVVVAVGAAFALTPRANRYKATSMIYVGSRVVDLKSAADVQYGQIATLDRFIDTFARRIDSEPTAAVAVQQARVDRSAAAVVAGTTTRQLKDTQLLAIDVSDSDPVASQKLANALADAFVEQVQGFEGSAPAGEGTVPRLPAYIFERARLPTVPEPTDLIFNAGVAAFIGLIVGIGLVVLLDYLDVTVRGMEDAERRLELPVLGSIPDLGAIVGPRRPPVGARVAS
jgi:succinoglycan biosynthesis transport protein ExoP